MRAITLYHRNGTKTGETLVDDADYERLSAWTWRKMSHGYAYRYHRPHGKSIPLLLHRAIMNPPDDMVCDHADGNILNNQRGNLRICSVAENTRNSKLRSTNVSGFKGVHWCARQQRFVARIRQNYVRRNLGTFTDAREAYAAYCAAAKLLHGNYARI